MAPVIRLTEGNATKVSEVRCLFVDVGGVLLSNGWDHDERRRAATHFQLGLAELEEGRPGSPVRRNRAGENHDHVDA